MTSRVNLGGYVEGEAVGGAYMPEAAVHRNITADIIDRAVEETFRDAQVSDDVAQVMRNLMVGDSTSRVARAYYHGVAAGQHRKVAPPGGKKFFEVPYVLDDEQVGMLSRYAADYDLRFTARISHDHPMAAACRSIERELLYSRLPPGCSVSDVGGAPVPLVQSGELGTRIHACSPIVDPKDPSRHVIANMRVKRIAGDVRRDEAVRASARGFLARDLAHTCGKKVQDCTYQTMALVSSHVYDVPMGDWGQIMCNKGADVVEGCLLFPRDIFVKSTGEMRVAGARYEVDAVRGIFRMGFVGSPAWWYQHDLSEFLKYGVDQLIGTPHGNFSYKVVERRGDTLFFRILRVSRTAVPNCVQHYRVPGVDMVRVKGFPVERRRSSAWSASRRFYMFPHALWCDMLGHAKDMVERGTLTHERLFNYYRTVAPRQSINAVVVAGGVTVDSLDDLVPLIVHVALFAYLEVSKSRAESDALLAVEMQGRVRERELTLYKLMAAFGEGLKASMKVLVAPLLWFAQAVEDSVVAGALAHSYDWNLVPTVQRVSVKLLLPHCFPSESGVVTQDGIWEARAQRAPEDAVRAAAASSVTAQFLLDTVVEELRPDQLKLLRSVVEVASKEEEAKAEEAVLGPSEASVTVVADGVGASAGAVELGPAEIARRRDAIHEAIVECDAEAAKSEAACADQFRTLMVGGEPAKKPLADYREMFANPDFWRVTAGVLGDSYLGATAQDFVHAAVYCPTPFEGQRLQSVTEQHFKGMSRGEYVERVHYLVADPTYTGWVYTNDSLLIHNGPAVSDALQSALSKPLDFSVVLNQGPPGCGKTTAVVNEVRPGDVVLVPVRMAARETAERVAGKGGPFVAAAASRVRTVDSYLVNRKTNKAVASLSATRLLADEAFMTREGRWYAAAAHLGATQVLAYGDSKQIPHVPRAECPKNHVSLRYQDMVSTFVSYRCFPALVACWGHVFDWRVRSASKVIGEVSHVPSVAGRSVPSGCVMMCAYQADKKRLREMYAGCGVPFEVVTIHEAEGKTYKHVWLHRLDLRVRTDNYSLYDKQEYVLVAMSRSTETFVYVAPDLGDLVSKFIKQGRDARRVKAAGDLQSAGQSVEFA